MLLALSMLGGTVAMAAERTLTDAAKGVVKISGKAGSKEQVSVLVTNPGYTAEQAETKGAIQYMQSFDAEEDGSYSHNIVLNADAQPSGYYKIYVKEGSGALTPLEDLYFASTDQKYNEMKRVCADTSLMTSDDTVKNVFGLNETLYTSINMSALSTRLAAELTENPIEFSDTDTEEQKLEKFTALSGTIKELAVTAAYNEGKSGVLFTAANGFEFDDTLKLSTLDTDKGVTAYALYSGSMTDAGRKAVQTAMLGKNAENAEALQRLFVKYVMLYGMTNNKDKGYGHIGNYITSANLCFALNKTAGATGAETYLALADKSSANYYIAQAASGFTADNFVAKIEEYAVDYGNKPIGQTGGTTTGGSGNKGGTTTSTIDKSNLYGKTEAPTTVPDNSTEDKQESTAPAATGVFKDVYDSFWGKNAIEYLYKKGVISGMTEDTFEPTATLTREQAVKILCLAFNIQDVKNIYSENGRVYDLTDYSMFDDVAQYDWYSEYVFAAYRRNIVNGIADKRFGVGESVTRQDIAVMLYRILEASSSKKDSGFDDAADIAPYAEEAVAYMRANGIISGYDDNTFKPQSFISRAEIAQIVYNILNKEGK